jgi:glycosyltransferase involved in cell wall biosynthesis
LRRIVNTANDRDKNYQWTFFCILPREGRDDSSVRHLGAVVLHTPYVLAKTTRFLTSLRRTMRAGHFDVLHCQHDLLSGLYLIAAVGIPFRKRIVHVHNTSLALPTQSRLRAQVGAPLLRAACLGFADNIVGVSGAALHAFLRGRRIRDGRDLIIPYGVDTTPLIRQGEAERAALRRRMGLGPSSIALLFVGRLVDSKNPAFCLRILRELTTRGVDAVLLYAGTGPARATLLQEADALGVADHVMLVGWRDDVMAIMRAADVLLWTTLESQMEGLGLVPLEAQAAGLPILATRSLPEEAVVVPELLWWLSISDGPGRWADAAEGIRRSPRPTRRECLARVEASPMALSAAATALFELYDQAMGAD